MTNEHTTRTAHNTPPSNGEPHTSSQDYSDGNTGPSISVTLPDPFDPSRFAVNSSVMGEIGVTKELVACPVRKPNKQEFVRVNPDSAYQLRACILELKDERETYLVAPDVAAMLPGETKTVDLRLSASRQGAIFIWPVPVPRIDGRDSPWSTSARTAAAIAEQKWVRLIANMAQGAYDVYPAPAAVGSPLWPEKSMRDILAIAFGEAFTVRDAGHPVIKRLMGLV
jgi:hypothetical protein